jgi:NTE family protein
VIRKPFCLRRPIPLIVLALVACTTPAAAQDAAARPKVGIAFGGGSARGFAHVGVIRWFEEHRIPIDLVAGTSMGGLVGGAFASGMSSQELQKLLAETDWDEMFGASSYRYKNIRRKQDARDYPSRLEFGAKGGLALPAALNNGQQVDLMLARIAAVYGNLDSFDQLPTPFRCVAVDLKTATVVVLDRGQLASALRATMSLPAVFPPVELDGRVLVDGGAMNNVPADVVRAMGANVVIAVNVGSMSETRSVSYSLLGLAGGTIDAMMQASTRRGMAAADIVLNPLLQGFGSLDWRRANEMADDGYRAAEAMKDTLLPYAVDEATWRSYLAAREARRRTALPAPASLTIVGALPQDEKTIRTVLAPLLGQPLDVAMLEHDLELLGGLDRYDAVAWELVEQDGRPSLVIRARPKTYGPPFLMLTVNLQNTTTDDFGFQLAARYLTFDLVGFGSELRVDAAVGSSASLGAELYRPIGDSPVFAAVSGAFIGRKLNFVRDDAIIAQYDQSRAFGGLQLGLNLGRDSEVRAGYWVGRFEANLEVGDPILPSLEGAENWVNLRWLYDSTNSSVVPSSGSRVSARVRHVIDSPDPPPELETTLTNDGLTQAEVEGLAVWSMREHRDRIFVTGGGGTSFDGHPLPTDQFQLGFPFRLGAFNVGERRGDHYLALTVGYLRSIARLPDFLGGRVFVGGWIENGSAFNDLSSADVDTHVSLGTIVDTLLGPAIVGASFGFDGQNRYYIGLGRLFP